MFVVKWIFFIMWQVFEFVYVIFKFGVELYFEDMFFVLDNFVQFGVFQFIYKLEYVQVLFLMVLDMFMENRVGGVDCICVCKFVEVMMFSFCGYIDDCVYGFIIIVMNVLSGQEVMIKLYKIYFMEMVINVIYYNFFLVFYILEIQGWINKFFSLWFGSMELFICVYDKRFCIMVIV